MTNKLLIILALAIGFIVAYYRDAQRSPLSPRANELLERYAPTPGVSYCGHTVSVLHFHHQKRRQQMNLIDQWLADIGSGADIRESAYRFGLDLRAVFADNELVGYDVLSAKNHFLGFLDLGGGGGYDTFIPADLLGDINDNPVLIV